MFEKNAHSFRQSVLLVIVGASLGIAPVLVSSYLQSGAQRQQYLFDRRLGALKDYSSSCARAIVSADRLLELQEMVRAAGSKRSAAQESWEFRQLEIIRSDLASANIEGRVHRDVVNAVFGLDLKTPVDEVNESTGRGENQADLREAIVHLSRQCNDILRVLASKLGGG